MARTKTPPFSDVVRQAQGMFAVNPMIAPQLEQFWKAQDSILNEAETYARAWFERRHAATRSALDIAREVNDAGRSEPATALQAISDWQRASMQRMAEDLQGWVDLCARCSGHLATAETEAAKEGVEGIEKRTAQAGKAKHPTPL